MAVLNIVPAPITEATKEAAEKWIQGNGSWLAGLIQQHGKWLKEERIDALQEAYDTDMESINKRSKERGDEINHKLQASYAQVVIDTVVDYMLGKPIVWTFEDPDEEADEKDVKAYGKELRALLAEEQAQRILREQLTQGSVSCYSAIIAWMENAEIDYEEFPVQEIIPVYDSRGRLKLLIRYYKVQIFEAGSDMGITRTKVEVYDDRFITYYLSDVAGTGFVLDPNEVITGNPVEHKAGRIPASLYVNGMPARYNKRAMRTGTSDLSAVFSVMENFAHVMSDKANTVDRILDQFLLLKGIDMGPREVAEKEVLMMQKARSLLLKSKESDASFIAPSQDDNSVENHLKRLKETIHELTFTPKITDITGSTATEIKMKYGGLDIKSGKKELYLTTAIKQLVAVLTDFINRRRLSAANVPEEERYAILRGEKTSSVVLYKPEWAQFTINRNLPQNFLEIAQIVGQLIGFVPDIYLYELLWFIEDPKLALEEMKKQKAEEDKRAAANAMNTIGFGGEFSQTSTSSTTGGANETKTDETADE
ncbi:phage portal protein [Domibacillus indicus]|uniref:phage portal protein n=1 Tax=Domibacillus indicus TaxID=1437523 RepID=UPI0020401FAD|nr:phage portal protein [Domibacillus indicus]MCM3789435.1 phage portal protein [Domibacillus indicus]